MKLLILIYLLIAPIALANEPSGNCEVVLRYYPDLGKEFARFLMEKNKDNDLLYENKFKHYLEEIAHWHDEYCKCVKIQAAKQK